MNNTNRQTTIVHKYTTEEIMNNKDVKNGARFSSMFLKHWFIQYLPGVAELNEWLCIILVLYKFCKMSSCQSNL